MCGIAGVVSCGADVSRGHDALDRMTPGILPRGPDGQGRLVEPGVALLHTRLAIIDLATGDQPIWNEQRDVGCIFNGEIYNFRHLREGLLARGHTLRTTSDTEVLVHLYEEHGEGLVEHIHGMYAFAIYDRRRRKVLLVRDRRGIKPLYVARFGSTVAFASSIESVLAAGASRDPDGAALAHYLRFYKVPEPRTAYRGVSALAPGHLAWIDVDSATFDERCFYELPRRSHATDGPGAVRDARSAFEQAIADHMIADVEVAAFLSGGIDSSLVVAQAQRIASKPLRTFCVSFEGAGSYDEAAFADRVARSIGTTHHTISVSAAPLDLLQKALKATQQPFAVASFLPLLLLCEEASKQVKVVLTGDGGDEVGFGYPWYRWARLADRVHAPRLRSLRRTARFAERVSARLRARSLRRAFKFASGVFSPGAERGDAWRYELTSDEATSLLRRDLRAPTVQPGPNAEMWDATLEGPEALRDVDMQVLLRDEMLPKLDRAGMAFGLEGRPPLLDDRFVEAMLQVPPEVHMRDLRGKAVLREWARELVPGIDAERPKHGFDVPIAAWMSGGLAGEVQRLLLTASPRRLIDRDGALRVWRQAERGVPGAAHAAYAMLTAELWFESPRF